MRTASLSLDKKDAEFPQVTVSPRRDSNPQSLPPEGSALSIRPQGRLHSGKKCRSEVLPGLEPGLQGSEPWVLTNYTIEPSSSQIPRRMVHVHRDLENSVLNGEEVYSVFLAQIGFSGDPIAFIWARVV